MNTEALITDNELRESIKTTEAVDWVTSLLERFHGSENNKQCLILKHRSVKEIIDELIPLSKYAQHKYNEQINRFRCSAFMKSEYQQIINKLIIEENTFSSITCLSICGSHCTCLL